MPTEDLRPTSHVAYGTGDTETVPLSYDGNVATEGRIGAEVAGTYHTVEYYEFPAGTINRQSRDAVHLHVHGMWSSFDVEDGCLLYFCPQAGGEFTQVDSQSPVDGWADNKTTPEWRVFDITALADEYAATGFCLAVTFGNGPGPPPPIPTGESGNG